MVALKDEKDGQLYLISGFRQKYAKKIWEQELALKKIDKKRLQNICKDGICEIPEHNLFVIFHEEYLNEVCGIENNKKIFVNLTEQKNYICENSALNINRLDLENNGSHVIWLDNGDVKVKHNGDYRFLKPWLNKF